MALVEQEDQLVSLSFLFDFSNSFIFSVTLIFVVYPKHQWAWIFIHISVPGAIVETILGVLFKKSRTAVYAHFNVFDILSVLFNCCFFCYCPVRLSCHVNYYVLLLFTTFPITISIRPIWHIIFIYYITYSQRLNIS